MVSKAKFTVLFVKIDTVKTKFDFKVFYKHAKTSNYRNKLKLDIKTFTFHFTKNDCLILQMKMFFMFFMFNLVNLQI